MIPRTLINEKFPNRYFRRAPEPTTLTVGSRVRAVQGARPVGWPLAWTLPDLSLLQGTIIDVFGSPLGHYYACYPLVEFDHDFPEYPRCFPGRENVTHIWAMRSDDIE
jgi:hypothetical protein